METPEPEFCPVIRDSPLPRPKEGMIPQGVCDGSGSIRSHVKTENRRIWESSPLTFSDLQGRAGPKCPGLGLGLVGLGLTKT